MQTTAARRSFLSLSAVLLAVLAVYLLLPTRMYYWDGVSFAIDIEKARGPADPLFHRHLLVYKILANWMYRLFQWAGHPVRALYVMQAANALLAAACVALVFLILRRMTLSTAASAALALLFAFSATWWRFATNVDSYIGSVFFLLLSYASLRLPKPAAGARGRPRLVSAALLHAAAMLLHQLAVWFFPAAVVFLWMRPGVARKVRLRAIGGYLAIAAAPVALLYLLAYCALRPAGSFPAWVSGHSPDSHFTFGFGRDFLYTMRGNLRLFFGGKLDALHRDWLQLAGLIALVMVLVLLAVRGRAMVGWLRTLAPGMAARLGAEAPLVVWLASYLLFLFFWQPEHEFYRLFYWPAVVFLLGADIAGREPRPAALLPLGAAFVALWNLVFLIAPQSRVEANQPLRFALEARPCWPGGTLIVFCDFAPDLWTISYFNNQASWKSSACRSPEEMESYRRRVGSDLRGVWLDSACYDALKATGPGAQWLAAHVAPGVFPGPARHRTFYRVRQP